MIIQPTNSLPGDFDAVNSEEIQNLTKETLPSSAVARGRFSILFKLEGKPDVEWKYASESARDSDYDAIIAAINASSGGPGSTPTLQEVTDEGAISTNPIIVGSVTDGTVIQSTGIGGVDGSSPTWGINNETGDADFTSVTTTGPIANSNGVIKPFKTYLALLNQSGTNAPVATSVEDNFGGIIGFGYTSEGIYTIDASEAIFTGTVIMDVINVRNVGAGNTLKFALTLNSTTQITLVSVSNGAVANDLLIDTPIEIRVYD